MCVCVVRDLYVGEENELLEQYDTITGVSASALHKADLLNPPSNT